MPQSFPKIPRVLFFSQGKGRAILWITIAMVAVTVTVLLKPWGRSDVLPLSFLSGNPVRGAGLFSDLGCNACHALHGSGPQIGPDLGKPVASGWNPVHLVADIWSHSPQMWEKMDAAQLGFPRVSETDMVDLLAYLYLVRYVDQPGDPDKGRVLFSAKHCADCHSISGERSGIGPALSRFGGDTPVVWAQRMWNHRRAMERAMKQNEIEWPTFRNQEMIDLLTFIQQATSGNRNESELFPADPRNGRTLFREKGCISCHAINGEGGRIGPDLGARHKAPPSITQFAGLMWNHSPAMLARMDRAMIQKTQFAEREMADLVAYLYVIRYMEPAGSVESGKRVFNQKHCSDCHGPNGRGGHGGPNLAHQPEYLAPQMAYIVWTHGPEMYRAMRSKNISWPTLNEGELLDLVAFLNSL